MTFEEFLNLIREYIGYYCNDSYWEWVYNSLSDKSKEYVEEKLSFLAINAIATDMVSKTRNF